LFSKLKLGRFPTEDELLKLVGDFVGGTPEERETMGKAAITLGPEPSGHSICRI